MCLQGYGVCSFLVVQYRNKRIKTNNEISRKEDKAGENAVVEGLVSGKDDFYAGMSNVRGGTTSTEVK